MEDKKGTENNAGFNLIRIGGFGGDLILISSTKGLSPDYVMYEVIKFLDKIEELGFDIEGANESIKKMKDEIDEQFEIDLIECFKDHKNCDSKKCDTAMIIKEFISKVGGLNNFSQKFQDDWNKLRPVTLLFADGTNFVIGGDQPTPIDGLIKLLDEIDSIRKTFGEEAAKEFKEASDLKRLLASWSGAVMILNHLLEISRDCSCDNRSCPSCRFLSKLFRRIDFKSLPQKTQDLYIEINMID